MRCIVPPPALRVGVVVLLEKLGGEQRERERQLLDRLSAEVEQVAVGECPGVPLLAHVEQERLLTESLTRHHLP